MDTFYRRLAGRIGNAKVVTATARKIAVLFYNATRSGMSDRGPGVDHYEHQYRDRVIKQLHRRPAQFGFALPPDQELIGWTLWRALRSKRPAPGLIHHSDRGTQYGATITAS